MFHNRPLNKKINRLHKRALRVIDDDYNETLEGLLHLDRSCTIHENSIQELGIEMPQVKYGLASEGFESIFVINNNSAQLRSKSEFCVQRINTKYFE